MKKYRVDQDIICTLVEAFFATRHLNYIIRPEFLAPLLVFVLEMWTWLLIYWTNFYLQITNIIELLVLLCMSHTYRSFLLSGRPELGIPLPLTEYWT